MFFSGSWGAWGGEVGQQEALGFHQGRLTCHTAPAEGDASWHPRGKKQKTEATFLVGGESGAQSVNSERI